MKRIVKWMSCIVSCCLLTGCTVQPYSLPSKQADLPANDVTVQIVLKGEEGEFLQTAAEAYQNLHSNVQIQIDRLPDNAEYNTELLSRIQEGNIPTAFSVSGKTDLSFWQDDVENLSNQEWISPVESSLMNQVTIGENYFALPLDLVGYGILYNQKLLDNMQINHDSIGTLKGLQDIVRELKSRKEETSLSSPVCGDGDFEDLFATYTQLDETNHEFHLPESFQWFTELVGKNDVGMDSVAMLSNQNAAIYLGGSDIMQKMKKSDVGQPDLFCMAPFLIDDQDKLVIGCDYLAIYQPAEGAKKDCLLDFLNWMYFSDEGQDLLRESGVLSPYTNTASCQVDSMIYSKCRLKQIIPSGAGSAPIGWCGGKFDQAIQNYYSGTWNWEQLFADLKSRW